MLVYPKEEKSYEWRKFFSLSAGEAGTLHRLAKPPFHAPLTY